jgi:hypothetical protein
MNTPHNDKIARLPREIRDQLNRRLHDAEPGPHLLEWLNSLPEARTNQPAESGGNPISDQDLTAWEHGGYRNWLSQQATLEEVRQLSADVAELDQAAEGAVTNKLAHYLSAQYVVAAKTAVLLAAGHAVELKTLQMLCGDVAALRRGDQYTERLRIDRENADFARETDAHKAFARVTEDAKQFPDVVELFRAAFIRFRDRMEGK